MSPRTAARTGQNATMRDDPTRAATVLSYLAVRRFEGSSPSSPTPINFTEQSDTCRAFVVGVVRAFGVLGRVFDGHSIVLAGTLLPIAHGHSSCLISGAPVSKAARSSRRRSDTEKHDNRTIEPHEIGVLEGTDL